MNFEYKIAFRVGDPIEVEGFLVRLLASEPTSADNPEYSVSLEADGFHFCDHTKSDLSCRVFRGLVDAALCCSNVVIHEL